ncbi:TfuA-like protein [Streptomyces sp. NPDC002403]
MTTHVFAGPTLTADEIVAILPHAKVHPPVRHGDLLGLSAKPEDFVVIIDGLFHQTAPVRHKEILALLHLGVTVVGASSMGALRAAEMYPLGMVGIGRVFEMYRDAIVTADDEVAVAHGSEVGSRSSCDPLVNIRYGVEAAVNNGTLTADQGAWVVELARSEAYPARSWGLILHKLKSHDATAAQRLADWLAVHRADTDIKRLDALQALRAVRDGEVPSHPLTALDGRWNTTHLNAWRLRFHVEQCDTRSIPRAAEVHYEQLFAPDFAQRWYCLAVQAMTNSVGDHMSLADCEERLLRHAGQIGISVDTVRADQVARWLSPSEIRKLNEDQQLLRLLVRTSTLSPGIPVSTDHNVWYQSLVPQPQLTRAAVAAAFAANTKLAEANALRTVHSIKRTSLEKYLSQEWDTHCGSPDSLNRLARDRGFTSFDNAIEVFRYFVVGRRESPRHPKLTTPAPEERTLS